MKRCALLLLALLSGTAAGQIPKNAPPKVALPVRCNLALAQSPVLRGFKLGMTTDEARKALAALEFTPAQPAGQVEAIYLGGKQERPALEGVKTLKASFFEDRLYALTVRYEDEPSWDSVEQFSTRVAQGLQLPSAWQAYTGRGAALLDKLDKLEMQLAGLRKEYTDEWPEARMLLGQIRVLEKELLERSLTEPTQPEVSLAGQNVAVLDCNGWRLVAGTGDIGAYLWLTDKQVVAALVSKDKAAKVQADEEKRKTWKP